MTATLRPLEDLVAEDDGAVRAAAVAVEREDTAIEGDSAGGGAICTAEAERILNGDPALVDGHPAGEAVLAGMGVVGGDVAQGEDAVSILDQAGRPGSAVDAIDDVTEGTWCWCCR